jgi:HEAT repeat protein
VNFDAIFRYCLDDPDAEVRAIAVDGLWENEEVALAGSLLTMLRADPSIRVRTAAAAGLGRYVLAGELERLEAPVQARIMIELLTTFHLAAESIEVRRRAIESAAYACTAEVHEALDMAYYDDDERMRLSAVVGMGRSCDQRWAKTILAEMESSLAAMRYEAVLASGELGLRQAVPALALLLEDADSQVREATIHALGQIEGPEARQVLLSAYDDADEHMRAALDEALAEQALAEGELDLMLYEVGDDLPGGFVDDELTAHSDVGDEETNGPDDWRAESL